MQQPPRIDAHLHFWEVARGDYGWLTPSLEALYRDFGPADYAPFRARAGIERAVLVQAAPTVAETRWLLQRAGATDWIVAVVGWVDMTAGDAPTVLAELARDPLLRGIRPMIQDIADPDWMLREDLRPAFAALEQLGLRFDALVLPPHLPLRAFPAAPRRSTVRDARRAAPSRNSCRASCENGSS